MTVEQWQEKFQTYLEGNLLPAEKMEFEKQIRDSETLTAELQRFRQLRILQKNETLFQGKSILGKVMEEVDIEPSYGSYETYFKNTIAGQAKWYWVGGIIVILILAAAGFLFQRNQASKQLLRLTDSKVVHLENMIGFADDDKGTAANGMRAYDQKDYPTAISMLHKAVLESPDDGTLRLYLGVSYLIQGQHTEASTILRPLTHDQMLATIPAKWYLALSLLKNGQKTEARTLLLELKTDKVYGGEATQVLEKLDL